MNKDFEQLVDEMMVVSKAWRAKLETARAAPEGVEDVLRLGRRMIEVRDSLQLLMSALQPVAGE